MKRNSRIKKKNKLAGLAALFVALCTTSPLAQAEIRAFKAHYGVQFMSVHAADVAIELEQLNENTWRMLRSSRAVGMARIVAGEKLKLDEQSWFKLQDQQPVPTRFLLEKPGAKKGRRRVDIGFSDTHALVNTDDAQKNTFKKTINTQDPVSAVVSVMLKMEKQQENFKLPIMARRGEALVSFEVLEHLSLETPAGVFDTLHIVQKAKKRRTDYWLAKEHNMVPVKIIHREKNEDGATMLLKKLSFAEP